VAQEAFGHAHAGVGALLAQQQKRAHIVVRSMRQRRRDCAFAQRGHLVTVGVDSLLDPRDLVDGRDDARRQLIDPNIDRVAFGDCEVADRLQKWHVGADAPLVDLGVEQQQLPLLRQQRSQQL
jgi:hypothetical protein